jgi:hypothetical protein
VAQAELLLNQGANVNATCNQGPALICALTTAEAVPLLKLLLSHGANPDLTDDQGNTALMRAARWNDLPSATYLLENHANINVVAKDGSTALIQACQHDHHDTKEQMIQLLVEQGADINATDTRGETALTYAGSYGHTSIVKYLQEKGALRTVPHVFAPGASLQDLTPAQAWCLAANAFYFQRNGEENLLLGGSTAPGHDRAARRSLIRDWEIHNRDELLNQLSDLLAKGFRTEYQKLGSDYAKIPSAQFATLIDSARAEGPRKLSLRKYYLKWHEREGLAFDLCRYLNLASDGYAAGYLTAPEAWDAMLPAAGELQKQFASWKEMGDNLLDGREIWSNSRDPDSDAIFELLINPQDPNSPWNLVPWETSLSN